ncbi:Uncharacterised protein [uncultured archaeon]|nr:Uncharacterised protein [uncultured archaeon]
MICTINVLSDSEKSSNGRVICAAARISILSPSGRESIPDEDRGNGKSETRINWATGTERRAEWPPVHLGQCHSLGYLQPHPVYPDFVFSVVKVILTSPGYSLFITSAKMSSATAFKLL